MKLTRTAPLVIMAVLSLGSVANLDAQNPIPPRQDTARAQQDTARMRQQQDTMRMRQQQDTARMRQQQDTMRMQQQQPLQQQQPAMQPDRPADQMQADTRRRMPVRKDPM